MDQAGESAHNRVVSLHLARTLDEVGLNKLTVKKRRHRHLLEEEMENVCWRLFGLKVTSYHFGSQTEGATTLGMHSDIDTLMCLYDVNVTEDWANWKQSKTNLLMLHEDTAPGYCRLQLLRPDVPMAREDLSSDDCTYDSSGRVIVKNTIIMHSAAGQIIPHRSGPAMSRRGGPGIRDDDTVVAILCRTWPAQAAEFTRRRRRHGWPSQRLIEEATSHGVFLVPVGYKLSPVEPLEWRISASMAERCLMFSLTIVHIKCYVVLKMFVKTFIEPRIRKCISSYHCKTALLHCTETTEPDFWREDNLLHCITRCLDILRNWVTDLFCPQFIISAENLFAGKVTIHNRDLLLTILTEMIRSGGGALLQVKMDDLGHKLQSRLNMEPLRVPIVDSAISVVLVGNFEHDRQKMLNQNIRNYIVEEANANQMFVIRCVHQKIHTLIGMAGHADKHELQAIQTFIPLLFCWLGSLLASFSLSHNRRVPRQAIQLMSTTADYDVASVLKLASVLYCSGKFGKTEALLKKVETQFQRNDMLAVCGCYDKSSRLSAEFCHMMFVLKGKKTRAKAFAHCVRFSRHEMHCAPPALRHELHRSIGDDIQHRHPIIDSWMVQATVDCLPFLYYLQFLTYKQLGKHDLQRRSLRNLDRCVREVHSFPHLETVWNLLGQCLEDEQDPDAATACYRASLEIRPRNNAANWHVAILWYKMVRNRGLLLGVTGDQVDE